MTEPDLKRDVAVMIEAEQRKLMAQMRRRTTLGDQEILTMLEPFSSAAFGAGYKLGWHDGELDVIDRSARWKLVAMLASAALVAWLLVTAL